MSEKTKLEKINVLAPLYTEKAAASSVESVLGLPSPEERQPDLQYFTAIFVSSGMNKNGAVFLGSELIKARNSIHNKAVDMEHNETLIVGQITKSAFLKRDRTPFDAEKASASPVEELDSMDMDIGIGAIVHKARFPDLAKEIDEGKWMVSMEAYYRDFDVKVGDMIIPKEKAVELGFDKLVGSVVQLKDGQKELGFHLVGRVLRDILFAGVGVVKNPANPRSVIMESAAMNDYVEAKRNEGEVKVIDLADLKEVEKASEINPSELQEFIKKNIFDAVEQALKAKQTEEVTEEPAKETAKDFLNHILPGTCVSYKRYVYSYPNPEITEPAEDLTQIPMTHRPGPGGAEYPGAEVAREHWCSLFDLECTARPGDATLPDCWRNVFARTMTEEVDSHMEVLRRRRIQEGLVSLQELIDDARKFEQ